MTRPTKIVLFVAGGLAGLVILVVLTATLLLRANLKSRVEAMSSKALDMEVNVGGRAAIDFFPRLSVVLADVHARKHGTEVASAGEISLGIDILPLLHKEFRISAVAVRKLRIALERGVDGKLNVARPPTAKGALPELTASDVRVAVDGKQGIFNFTPVTMRLIGGHGSGSIRADFSGSVPVYHVRYELAHLQIEEFFKTVAPKQVGTGSMDFATTLSLRGRTPDALKRSAEGEASLHGENLRLQIGDLDKKFAQYESSQNFNLVDVGAFFFVGPLGSGSRRASTSRAFSRIREAAPRSTCSFPSGRSSTAWRTRRMWPWQHPRTAWP